MPKDIETVDTVVVGAGQAGLVMSKLLSERGRDHIVVEREDHIAHSWRSRWDSFTLVTPNWWLQLPGHPYAGEDPNGFLTRDEVVRYLEDYAAMFDPPIRFGTEVTSVERADDDGFVVETDRVTYRPMNVVVTAGTFQRPSIPPFGDDVPPSITRLHSSEYRNPDALDDGAVLVVGSGQSGCQIALELHEAGRDVSLATGRARRLPRSYRGRDGMWWAHRLGMTDQSADELDDPAERFVANPHVSGRNGGEGIDLHDFARSGITLFGHLTDVRDGTAIFADDLHDNLAVGDQSAAAIRDAADALLERTGLDLPEEEIDEPRNAYDLEPATRLDLVDAGITAIIWATGFRWDFGWIDLPVLDDMGYPVQRRGVTEVPGLYFLGLHWLHSLKSGLFLGVGEDALHVATHLAGRPERRSQPA